MDVPKTIDNFFASYQLRKYTKGQILLLNWDDAKYVYYLISGRVKQYDVTHKGDEIILNTFKPPAFFPMSLAINQAPNPYTYEAETDLELRQAPVKDVIAFLKAHPEVTFDLLSRVYRGADGLLSRMAYLMASSAKRRLMFELLVACKRYGKQTKHGFTLAMTETELAARAGLTRETVSREMKKLTNDSLVTIGSSNITIPDIDKYEIELEKVV